MRLRPSVTSLSAARFGLWALAGWTVFVFFCFFSNLYHAWPAFFAPFDAGGFPPVSMARRLEVWAGLAKTLAVGAWITGIFWSLGGRLRKGLGLRLSTPGIRFCFDWVFGLFLMNLFWLGTGLARLWLRPFWTVAFILLTLLLLKDLLLTRRNLPSAFKAKKRPPFWAFLVPLYFLFLLAHSLLPETFYDSLNYFLGMPAFWLFKHGISDDPVHLLSGYFHGGSLFFMNGLVFAGTEGAKLLGAVVLALCAFFAGEWVGESWGFKPAVVAGTAVLTFPLLYLNTWAARVDGLTTLVLLLFFYCLERASRPVPEGKDRGRTAWVLAAGLLAGLAVSIKPTAAVGVLAALLACLWQRGPSFFRDKRVWAVGAACALLEVGPWLLKNAVFTGNPFFPYAGSWMGGRAVPLHGYERLLGENRQYLPMDHGFWSVLTLPWRLTMPQAGDGQFIGPLFLAFLPALFFLRSSREPVRFLSKTVAVAFLLGLSLSHMLRFSMPAFVLALVVFSAVLAGEKGRGWGRLWILGVAACAVLCFGKYLDLSASHYRGAGLWSGRETRRAYLERELPDSYEPLAAWTADHLPRDVRLLIVGDSRGVYYRRPFLANSVFDEPFLARAARGSRDARGIAERLRELGVDYLAVNIPEGLRTSKEYGLYELTPAQWARLNEFLDKGLRLVFWRDFLAVYRVKDRWGPEKGPYVVNPFSFFCPAAYDFIEDFQARRYGPAEADSSRLLDLFPREAYWWEKRALLESAEGKAKEAFRDFRRAGERGGLTVQGYRGWIALAEARKDPFLARRVRRRAEAAYPNLFKD